MSVIRPHLCMVILLSYSLLLAKAWNLSHLNLYPNNYTITDVSIYYIRSFICIKSTNESATIPTLIEAIWPENLLQTMFAPKIFPSDLNHARHPSSCNGIIQAVATDVDDAGLLWVIDNGSKYCRPKLIVFDLMNNEEIHRYHFKIIKHTFTSIKIGHTKDSDCSGRQYVRVFITLDNADYLVVYSVLERRWWKLRLITNENMIVIPKEIAIVDNDKLFITDGSGHLWTAKLSTLRRTKTSRYHEIKVDFVADLLGTSTTLTSDQNSFLYYYLPRDGAVVRWNSRKPLNAENHDVLYMSSIPIVEIIFGVKGSVWIVRESPNYIEDHCERILFHY